MRLLLDENQVGMVNTGPHACVELHACAINAERQKQLFPVENVHARGPGPSNAAIGFPHLVMCQGVVVTMTNGTLIGAHVSGADDEGMLLDKMSEMINQNGGPDQISQMYVAYDANVWQADYGRSVAEKAARFGFTDKVRVVDTANVHSGNGSYVQFTAMGSHGKCLVETKDNREMAYQTGGGMNMRDDLGRNRDPLVKVGAQTTAGTMQVATPVKQRV